MGVEVVEVTSAAHARQLHTEAVGRESSMQVGLGELDEVCTTFGLRGIKVVGKDLELLHGEDDEWVAKCTLGNRRMMLLLVDGHYMLVTSYVALMNRFVCPICDKRFQKQYNLQQHLRKKVCLKCNCIVPGQSARRKRQFETVEEWRAHMASTDRPCLENRARRERHADANRDAMARKREQQQRHRNRFLTPEDTVAKKVPQRVNKTDLYAALDGVARTVIYFDLESIAPVNPIGVPRSGLRRQQPYAAGWIDREELIRGGDVHIAYGADCVEVFLRFVEMERESVLERVTANFTAHVEREVTRGDAARVKRVTESWLKKMKTMERCPACGAVGDMVTHGSPRYGQVIPPCLVTSYVKTWVNMLVTVHRPKELETVVYAHNGGGYDWFFIHQHLLLNGRGGEVRCVRQGSRYLSLTYRGDIRFLDSIAFIPGSLESLAKNFKVKTQKGQFPYTYMSSMDRIYDVHSGMEAVEQNVGRELFQVTETLPGPMKCRKKRPFTQQEYNEFMEERGWVYDVRLETISYLKDDVRCLGEIVEKYREGWLALQRGPDIFDYMTIGQMSHDYFIANFMVHDKYICLGAWEDAFIRGALYGGRTEVFARNTDFQHTKFPIHYLDVNSLYPYVMEVRDLPGGDPVWHISKDSPLLLKLMEDGVRRPVYRQHDEVYFQELVTALNAGTWEGFGFLDLEITPPADLHLPVLPQRVETENGPKNMFDLMPKSGVYYSEEVKLAVRKGYVVNSVRVYSEWERVTHYRNIVKELKKEKMRGEGKDEHGTPIPGLDPNPSLRQAAKTGQNVLFGKTIQKCDTDKQFVVTHEQLWKSFKKQGTSVKVWPVIRTDSVDVVEVVSTYTEPRAQKRACAAVGTAILAEARMVLYRYFEEVEKVDGVMLYCDTDSIVFTGPNNIDPSTIHDSAYGAMKVEIDPNEIVEGGFVGLAPKCYAFNLKQNGQSYIRCKGVSLADNMYDTERRSSEDGIDDLLAYIDMEDTLADRGEGPEVREEQAEEGSVQMVDGVSYNKLLRLVRGELQQIRTEQMSFVKDRARNVSVANSYKLLRDRFDKRKLLDNGMTTPWTPYNRDTARMRVDHVYLSNFLQNGELYDIANFLRTLDVESNNMAVQVVRSWLRRRYDDANSLLFQEEVANATPAEGLLLQNPFCK
jgi:transposase-like protein